MPDKVLYCLLVLLTLVLPVGWGQVDKANQIQGGSVFLDSNADCNGPVRELYGQTARVIGHGAVQVQQGPRSCTLTLRSSSNYDKTNLYLEIVAATIRDPDVRLTIYDGLPTQGVLKAYDINSNNMVNQRNLVTTGDSVSFTLERRDATNTLYDIEVFVTPLVSGTNPGYENDYGSNYGFFREKFPNRAAVGVVGAAFLIVLITLAVFVAYCYCRFKGLNKPWQEHQLSNFQPPPVSTYGEKSMISEPASDVWTSNVSRGASQYAARRPVDPRSRLARPSEDVDSVFSDGSITPPKKRLMEQERLRERQRMAGRGRDNRSGYAANQNTSFVQADDDHPQDTFIERIIEPRVHTRIHKPPSYSEAINEVGTEVSDLEEEPEEEGEEESSDENEESSEQEEESEEEEEEEETKPTLFLKPAPQPKPPQIDMTQRQVQSQPQPQPQPQPQMSTASLPLMQHHAYPGYPPMQYVGGYPMVPGQFMPVMTAPQQQQFRPVAVGPGYPPPNYPGGVRPLQSNIKPTDPPVYSYLVQRGYRPLDEPQSAASSLNTSQHSDSRLLQTDESETNNLHSGVEYMKR